MKHILVPTDFSKEAYNALSFTTQLLNAQSCTFHLLHVYNARSKLESCHSSGKGRKVFMDQLRDDSQAGLLKILRDIVGCSTNPAHRFTIISKKGEIIENIALCTYKLNIDLVVLGVKERKESNEIFLGRNTIRTIGAIKKSPILVLPGMISYKPPKRIVLGTYFGKNLACGVLDPMLNLAKMFKSSITIIYPKEKKELTWTQKLNKAKLEQQLKELSHVFHWKPKYAGNTMTTGSKHKGLEADLLVMANYEHSLLERLVCEPVILEIITSLTLPLMIIPSKD